MKKKRKFDIQKILSKFKTFKKEGEVVAIFLHREIAKTLAESSSITIQYFTKDELGRFEFI